jgi:hypothetical protein
MPTTTNTPIRAYAHCVNSHCAGNAQTEVDALSEETTWLFTENGGDLAMPERSSVNYRFVNRGQEEGGRVHPDDSHCPTCGRNRDLSPDKRTQFDGSISNYDPNALLELQSAGVEFDPSRQTQVRQEPDAVEAENAELRERLARLEGFMLGQHQPEEPVE